VKALRDFCVHYITWTKACCINVSNIGLVCRSSSCVLLFFLVCRICFMCVCVESRLSFWEVTQSPDFTWWVQGGRGWGFMRRRYLNVALTLYQKEECPNAERWVPEQATTLSRVWRSLWYIRGKVVACSGTHLVRIWALLHFGTK